MNITSIQKNRAQSLARYHQSRGPRPDCKDCGRKNSAHRTSNRCDKCHLAVEDKIVFLRKSGAIWSDISAASGLSMTRVREIYKDIGA